MRVTDLESFIRRSYRASSLVSTLMVDDTAEFKDLQKPLIASGVKATLALVLIISTYTLHA